MACNFDTYSKLLDKIVDFYFADYHDHEKEFRPVFLLNDIIRFWKTLCLNYEHKRWMKNIENDIKDEKEMKHRKAKVHLKNLKLKYSRLLTCYSMVVRLAMQPSVSKELIKELICLTPLDRVSSIEIGKEKRIIIEEILGDYEKFLSEVSKDNILELMEDKQYRNLQFDNARNFSGKAYQLLRECAQPTILRYITI